jgi:uncharacterized protein YcfL
LNDGVNRWYLLIPLCVLGACAGHQEPLVVKQFKILDQKMDAMEDPMVRSQKQRRLHGAVSVAERNARLGTYYTLLWSDPQGVGTGAVELLFEYQQGATASLVKRMVKRFNSSEASGMAEFAVIGNDYLKHGRVLAWRATLSRGGRLLATRKSHLWQ